MVVPLPNNAFGTPAFVPTLISPMSLLLTKLLAQPSPTSTGRMVLAHGPNALTKRLPQLTVRLPSIVPFQLPLSVQLLDLLAVLEQCL